MITATPFLAAAADAKLEDWGPLEEDRDLAGPRDHPQALRFVLIRLGSLKIWNIAR
jgi:hypothetical protein